MQQINDRQQLKYVHMTLGTESYGMPARRASKIKIDSLTKPRFLRWYFKTNPEEGIGRIIHNPWNQHPLHQDLSPYGSSIPRYHQIPFGNLTYIAIENHHVQWKNPL